MSSTVDTANIVFGANFHDDGVFDASLNTTISSTFSFGDFDGNVDYEGDFGSANCSSVFSSPDFTFKTPKKIVEEHGVGINVSDDDNLANVHLDGKGNEIQSNNRGTGPFYSPKNSNVNDIATKFSSCIGISSNSEGTKLLKKSVKKPNRTNENENDTTRNIQNYDDTGESFRPFKHDIEQNSSRGPGAWFWGDGTSGDVGVDAPSGSSSENSFVQTQNQEPSVSFSIGQSSTGTYSIRRKREIGKNNPQRKQETSLSNAPSASPELSINTEQKYDNDQKFVAACGNGNFNSESISNQFRIQGKKLYEMEDYENALDAFSNCLAACPEDWPELPGVLGNRAATFMMLERYVEAIEDCGRAVKLNPSMLRLLDRKGRAQLKLGMLADAETTFHDLLSACKKAVKFDAQIQKDAWISLKQVEDSRRSVDTLKKWKSDNRLALEEVERLLEVCPHMRAAQTLKGTFLCNLQKWDEAKLYIETTALGAHDKIQRLFSHPRAAFPCPQQNKLVWKCNSLLKQNGHNIEIDRYAISNAMLCMGSDMARVYLVCLKNLSICRNHSSEAMSILSQLLTILASTVSDWKWVKTSANLLKESIELKNSADEKFRVASYNAAIGAYSEALRKDPEAYRWNAVLYCNRAAAYMNLQKYTEAINDCHQSLARDKQYVKALLRRGRAHRASGNYNSAITDFQNYLSSQPAPQDAEDIKLELDDILQSQREESRRPPPPQSSQYHFHNPKFNTNSKNGSENTGHSSAHSSSSTSSQSHSQGTFFRQYRDKNGPNGSGSSFPGAGQRPSQRHPYGTRGPYEGDVPPPPPPPNQHHQRRQQQQQRRPNSPPRPPPSLNPNDQDHYSQLGLSSTATDKDIKTAYRKLALKYHPDKNKDAGAEDIFKAISTAHTVLSDKDARRKYDLSRPLFNGAKRYH